MKRPPRKIITRAIVFLLAGAIVNVAVAWGLSAFMPLETPSTWRRHMRESTESDLAWMHELGWRSRVRPTSQDVWKPPRSIGAMFSQCLQGRGVEYWLYHEIGESTEWTCAVAVYAGWPMECL